MNTDVEHVSLTPSQSAVLFALMSEARDVPNSELRQLAPELTRESRERLNDLGLIESVQAPGVGYAHSLTDRGWVWCTTELTATPPNGAHPAIRALYTVLAGVGRYLETEDLRLHEVFRPRPVPIDERIRTAYAALASRPGAWVSVSALRDALSDVDTATLDETLVELQRTPGVSLIPQEDRALLTDDERAAAVIVGTQTCHLFAIEER
ncbi:MarR family transcriptional regulator [Gordonia sp. CPCC 205515]|uniref:MarR family transcriptional regulator n=1 Tax=Gordonia sp. CPCC 205515 TaxID=3140791 RepID=UPI003AF35BC0